MIGKIACFCKKLIDWFKSDRCFVSYFIKAFPLANNLLMLMILMLSFFIIVMYGAISTGIRINTWLSMLIITLLIAAFASGFFYLMKTNVDKKVNGETVENNNFKFTFSTFYAGIGENYLSFVALFILFMVLATLVVFGTILFVDKFFFKLSELGNSLPAFFEAITYPNQADSILQQLDEPQKLMLRTWSRSFLITTQTFTFLIMLWIPETLYTKKNVIVTLFTSIKKLFTEFPNSLCVYLTIMLLNFLVAVLTLLFGNNTVGFMLLHILSFYLLIYNFYAIFFFYNDKFIDIERKEPVQLSEEPEITENNNDGQEN